MKLTLPIIVALSVVLGAIPLRADEIDFCEDDASFRLNGRANRDCSWAGEKRSRIRCHRKDKTTGKKVLHYCPLTCTKKCAYPRNCEQGDDPDFRYDNDNSKDCSWAAADQNDRCDLTDSTTNTLVRDSCPASCNLSCSCTDAVSFDFNGVNTNCADINTSQCREKAKKKKKVAHYCPATCNTCLEPRSATPSASPTSSQTASPSTSSLPSEVPSSAPSATPSGLPSMTPSMVPSSSPSYVPSSSPSDVPSNVPSNAPSTVPSGVPSNLPSNVPSNIPSSAPSDVPSNVPSNVPSMVPSIVPSSAPSTVPSMAPSMVPSKAPSNAPSMVPSVTPSMKPSMVPSVTPSMKPSMKPSFKPSMKP
eukprot:CAMPEP_0172382224 /NCGR_PEP_ID=MMETSP1061-20121228/206_1 /TAXON_ID=37318 /ORGANISM="Pseudo-nitzschia pungens, Strain cf. pungens" /LENGTH=361 /DNA_ID=CAMNT_0013110055 /DNA_START=103 /DNA_END=1184 /DNA_ORIENTATION=-